MITEMQGDETDGFLLLTGMTKDQNYPIIGSDELENQLTSLLTVFVSRFILMHELGHLFNGHCQYLSSLCQSDKMNYFPMFNYGNSKIEGVMSNLDWRTLEYDADSFAITGSFQYLMMLYQDFDNKVDTYIIKEPSDLFYWWGFAIRSEFLLMQKIFSDDNTPHAHHFPSSLRWITVILTINGILYGEHFKFNYVNHDNAAIILEKIFSGASYAERYFTKVNKIDNCLILDTIENHKCEHLEDVEQNWKKMLIKLKPFTRLYLYQK